MRYTGRRILTIYSPDGGIITRTTFSGPIPQQLLEAMAKAKHWSLSIEQRRTLIDALRDLAFRFKPRTYMSGERKYLALWNWGVHVHIKRFGGGR